MEVNSRIIIQDMDNRPVAAKVGRGWVGKGCTRSLGLADANYYIYRMDNKVLLYSTGNYIQYPVINHNAEYEKECTCITESLCYAAAINTL